MSNTIIEAANEYTKMARLLESATTEAGQDGYEQGFIENALLRLFYVKSLEQKLEKYQEALYEQTDMDTFDAVTKADETIERVSQKVFEQIESYIRADKKFEILVDAASVDLTAQDKNNLLIQLYKCEGIIQMALATSRRYSLYGSSADMLDRFDGAETESGKTPEQVLSKDRGVDIYKLFDIREQLIGKLETIVKATGSKDTL